MDQILFDHGIDCGAAFCGAIDGNTYWCVMENVASFSDKLKDYVVSLDSRLQSIDDSFIKEMTDIHVLYLEALN